MAGTIAVLPGKPEPLGACWDGAGVNFAVFSAHAEAMDLCLFGAAGAETRLALPGRSGDLWHGYCPGLKPGQLYGYRAHGPWRPADGHRFDASKLLIDPYARALDRIVRWQPLWSDPRADDRVPDGRDTAAAMPKARVAGDAFDWGGDRPPRVPWDDSVILELHVRGMTMLNAAIPPELRGTFAGLGAANVTAELRRMGVTAVELMPVHAFVDDARLVGRGLVNYWGYNSIAFFAPDPRYLASGAIAETKETVKRLHAAGIEVLLDVVYNHSGEGDQMGPTLSFRGLDNASYYRLREDRRLYVDDTGTGNTLNVDHPRVLGLVLDSLRYWVAEMHVDGFRFDLAPALARVEGRFRSDAPFFAAIARDPVLSGVKLIAEPWDAGPHGFRLGEMPLGWAEWNARYRDTVRRFWRGDAGQVAALASRIAGSSDLFGEGGRLPSASINYVTCHDGFTLHDLVSYGQKHNEANGEHNRDGTDENESANYGVEGPARDPALVALRERQKRNFLATLLFSVGVPMLLMGDDRGRSQNGNNNAYCQDGALSWLVWQDLRREDENLCRFAAALVALRRRTRLFRAGRFLAGAPLRRDGLKDIAWLRPDGGEAQDEDWRNPDTRAFGYALGADPPLRSLLVLMNAGQETQPFRIPHLPQPLAWRPVIDTADPSGFAASPRLFLPGETFSLGPRSFVLFRPGDDDEAPP